MLAAPDELHATTCIFMHPSQHLSQLFLGKCLQIWIAYFWWVLDLQPLKGDYIQLLLSALTSLKRIGPKILEDKSNLKVGEETHQRPDPLVVDSLLPTTIMDTTSPLSGTDLLPLYPLISMISEIAVYCACLWVTFVCLK